MKNKKVTVLTICVVLLAIALIGVSVFCVHLINKQDNEAKDSISSQENVDTDNLASVEPEKETPSDTPDTSSQEVVPESVPEATPEPPALNLVQAELHRKYHGDEATAKLLEKGYFYEVSETLTDGAFEVNLVGFTGDTPHPMILLDVLVNDASLLDAEDKLFVELYCLGTYQYENMLSSYGTCRAYGVRDEENSQLFHVSMPGTSRWISGGEEFIIDVTQICIGSSEVKDDSWDAYDVNMKHAVTVPQNSLLQIYSYGGNRDVFEDDNMKYMFDLITPGFYETSLLFYIDYSNSQIANMNQDASFLTALYDRRDDFMEDLVVTINDIEYSGASANSYAVTVTDDACYFYTSLPGIESTFIYGIEISHGETSYKIK